jgi:hypothetical protein
MNAIGLQCGEPYVVSFNEKENFSADMSYLAVGADISNNSEIIRARDKRYEIFYLLGFAQKEGMHVNTKFNPSYFTQIECVMGLGVNLKIGFNPGELIDFILGWTTIDIYGDDIEMKILEVQPPSEISGKLD